METGPGFRLLQAALVASSFAGAVWTLGTASDATRNALMSCACCRRRTNADGGSSRDVLSLARRVRGGGSATAGLADTLGSWLLVATVIAPVVFLAHTAYVGEMRVIVWSAGTNEDTRDAQDTLGSSHEVAGQVRADRCWAQCPFKSAAQHSAALTRSSQSSEWSAGCSRCQDGSCRLQATHRQEASLNSAKRPTPLCGDGCFVLSRRAGESGQE